jgi:hypothetical protein
MAERVASIFVWGLYAYAILGGAFAAVFVTRGVQKLDAQAQGAGIAFRLLIFPGAAAFWPLLARRWIRGDAEPPAEGNPHR